MDSHGTLFFFLFETELFDEMVNGNGLNCIRMPELEEEVPSNIIHVIQKCLQVNVENRPSFEEIVKLLEKKK